MTRAPGHPQREQDVSRVGRPRRTRSAPIRPSCRRSRSSLALPGPGSPIASASPKPWLMEAITKTTSSGWAAVASAERIARARSSYNSTIPAATSGSCRAAAAASISSSRIRRPPGSPTSSNDSGGWLTPVLEFRGVLALGEEPSDDLHQDLALGSEMPVERALGQAGPIRDVLQRHRVVAPLDEELAGDGHQMPPRRRRFRRTRRIGRHEAGAVRPLRNASSSGQDPRSRSPPRSIASTAFYQRRSAKVVVSIPHWPARA